jgi:hypothetical protein
MADKKFTETKVSDRFLIKQLRNRISKLESNINQFYDGSDILLEHETTKAKYKLTVTGEQGSETITLTEV